MRRSFIVFALTGVSALALTSTLAWSLTKSSPGCPRRPVEAGSPCKKKHATCHWACAHEDLTDVGCVCEKDEQGAWRWQCSAESPPCRL
jgi:hypothetical protein